MIKKQYRLKTQTEIDYVFKQRQSVKNKWFSVYFIKQEQPHYKMALSIGRKYGNAVQRNLIKRRLRMIIKQIEGTLNNQTQFVIVIHPVSRELTFQEIKKQIYALLNKASIMEK